MRRIAVVDCETDPFQCGRVPKPFVWGYYDGERYRQWPENPVPLNAKPFVKFLRDTPQICYAHNGGKFDWHFLLDQFEPYDDVMVINGRIAKGFIGLTECRDSYNILPVPLKAYKKDDIDYRLMEEDLRYKPENWRKISEYLKSDCIYLYELVSRFIDAFGLQLTQAGAAMAQWKKISMMDTPRTDAEFYERLSPYYYGGRVQCFRSGIVNTRFSVYDINSAYPRAMMESHPYTSEMEISDDYMPDADFYRVECVSRGAFPFRGEGNPEEFAGLRFPDDNQVREYTITGWEYEAAKELGALSRVKVKESIYFPGRTDFRKYIEHFYNMRLRAKAKGNEAESLFAKLLMNSLYGKFAANPENYRNYIIVPMDMIPALDSQGWAFAGELGPWALGSAPLDESAQRFYNVATGASITGYVRAMLFRAIASSKGMLYCDTDSIACEKAGSFVKLGDQLGQWKHEGNFDKAGIAGKKLYIFRGVPGKGGKREIKLASKGARLTEAQLWELARGGDVEFISDVPTFSVRKAPAFVNRKIRYTAQKKGKKP